ncbi:hypothetical protein QAD02_001560 [Eretmocerus hayati]|uniref:Uncharacterized protein n=1 Tax=Eretmocerus hayati TaxID=131215 RepID=A0ACC2NI49_9HYME|nr:hypothetical protein QAD02_001560 [Eretmocerus hayati]
MGCVHSRKDINDLDPNVFQVMNVDDLGNLIMPGKLEVTESDIILYQKAKPPVEWPLRCLRRYGYDAEIFSFESGRRCSTGPGIYAFKSCKAAQLFSLVQANIQKVYTNGDDAASREVPISSHPGPTITRVTIPTEPNYLDPTPTRVLPLPSHAQRNGRLSSADSSSGPMSPQGTMGSPSPPPPLPLTLPPPPPISQNHQSSLYINEEVLQSSITADSEHNNNKSLARRSMQRSHTMCNSTSVGGFMVSDQTLSEETHSSSLGRSSALPPSMSTPSYMNVNLGSEASLLSPSCESITAPTRDEIVTVQALGGRAYMNISPGHEQLETRTNRPAALSIPPITPSTPVEFDDVSITSKLHCYANLEPGEIEGLRKRFSTASISDKLPQTPSPALPTSLREVKYLVLDLDKKETLASIESTPSQSQQHQEIPIVATTPPDSPLKSQQLGYVTIDFNKTAALSNSVNPGMVNDIDEGSRRTRHNSSINELVASTSSRHNSFISE